MPPTCSSSIASPRTSWSRRDYVLYSNFSPPQNILSHVTNDLHKKLKAKDKALSEAEKILEDERAEIRSELAKQREDFLKKEKNFSAELHKLDVEVKDREKTIKRRDERISDLVVELRRKSSREELEDAE